ncbi:hypothetical protein BSKO_11446 [Bryopsis sp. KO-2023]|nr:hypothetical protein BSKO_11446 [Bryopsis sp. KO-2023]
MKAVKSSAVFEFSTRALPLYLSGNLKAASFVLPVDSEHKAAAFKPWRFRGVHMTAFHASWISMFISFMSTFAPAALIPVIRDDLDLKTSDLANAGIAAVTGVIAARAIMGALCDTLGPRIGHAGLSLLTAPAVFGMGLVRSAAGFVGCRFVIGFSMATFVACQYWSSVMFNVQIVGIVNATGAGWGNTGGGATHFLMPIIFTGFTSFYDPFVAWRFALWIPGLLHIAIAFVILAFAQDMPDGSFYSLQGKGQGAFKAMKVGLTNHRMWLLALLYGYSFGVELTIQNVVVSYFFDNFTVSFHNAGILASVFGLLNIFARTIGGAYSDLVGKKYGMRGRLAAFWVIQMMEGILVVCLGLAGNNLLGTILLMAVFSIFVQASEGACYGIVPFVSKRALGVVTGFVGAGGNIGSVVLQAAFFRSHGIDTDRGFILMGITVMVVTQAILFIRFPQWGGVFSREDVGCTEEDYYLGEYSQDEIAQGLANASIVFANEAITQRGEVRLVREAEASRAASRSIEVFDIARPVTSI